MHIQWGFPFFWDGLPMEDLLWDPAGPVNCLAARCCPWRSAASRWPTISFLVLFDDKHHQSFERGSECISSEGPLLFRWFTHGRFALGPCWPIKVPRSQVLHQRQAWAIELKKRSIQVAHNLVWSCLMINIISLWREGLNAYPLHEGSAECSPPMCWFAHGKFNFGCVLQVRWRQKSSHARSCRSCRSWQLTQNISITCAGGKICLVLACQHLMKCRRLLAERIWTMNKISHQTKARVGV